ncbi:conserved hypothetical protein [Alteracholeplasma palmae J233]|uniref:Uncharacterized protein n=1 Tax=Alteracholeplasma palmae (strain ATCC 49389 / J233) TaxID=1318466 RepID=U4KPS6_ALTPJ|nr:hypothetical protein [Alteracholeplasma palmae]CCV64290.1 conserved hypothetical protein [Alteracholeplasma palmae J233]
MRKQISSNKFLNNLYQYRLIIFVVFFVIIVPVVFLTFLYLGNYLKYNKVTFNEELVSSNFRNLTYHEDSNTFEVDLGDFTFVVEPDRITTPKKSITTKDEKEVETLVGGNYLFNSYIDKKQSDVTNLKAQFVLQTQWIDNKNSLLDKDLVEKNNSSSYSKRVSIDYNFMHPTTTLAFISVKRPDLYIALTYKNSSFENQTFFLKADLQNISIKTFKAS